jgi:hypothetical protein
LEPLKTGRILWLSSLTGARRSGEAKVDHCLKMKGLGEEVGEGDGFNLIAGGEQGAEVASERGGVTGDVDERWGGDLGEECGDFRAQAGAGWVDHNQIRTGGSGLGGAAEEVEGGGADGDAAGAFEVGGESLGGGRGGLDGDDAGEIGGERAGEEAYAGEKVPGECAFVVGGDAVDERIDEPAVYLKKSAVVDAVIEPSGAVGERGCAPLGYGSRGLGVFAGAGFKKKLSAGEGGDALAPGFDPLVEAMVFGAGGEDAGLEGGFGGIAEKSEFSEMRKLGDGSGDVGKGLGGIKEQGRGDGAFGDGDDGVGISGAVAGIACCVEGNADAIAVVPGVGGEDGDLVGGWNAGAIKGLKENGLLEGELGFVVRMLIVATAADAEVAADGSDALGGDGDDLVRFGCGVAGLVLGDADAGLFAGEGEGDEEGFAFYAGKECAAVEGLGYVDELGFGKVWVSCGGAWRIYLRG